jgi:hypothetical protein
MVPDQFRTGLLRDRFSPARAVLRAGLLAALGLEGKQTNRQLAGKLGGPPLGNAPQ